MYLIKITETGASNTREQKSTFNRINESFISMEGIKDLLIDRYGKIPSRRNKIYRDTKDGKSEVVGFSHSFWNQDISHNSPKWHQTDWIEVYEQTLKPIIKF